ncbi:hypothetical protein IIA95_03205, partial [Patescibacteria group bacterium]|nr:hypothetical protein [Patescibacteria group bacterium]
SATAARGALDPGVGDATLEVGTTDKVFSSIKITAGSAEKLWLQIMRWNQTGSAGSGDLGNVVTIIDGVSYPTTVSSDGKFYSTVFPGKGLLIDKGFSKDITIRGDILGGSARSIDFDVDRRSDITLLGNTFGYNILATLAGSPANVDSSNVNDSDNPYYDASQHTISAGTITVSSWSGVAAQNIAENVADQPIAGFSIDVKGEAISVGSSRFNFTIVGATDFNLEDVTNLVLVNENGSILAGPVDGSGAVKSGTVTFTDTITYQPGVTNLTLKGKIGTDADNNDTIAASTTPSTDWTTVTGQTTGNTITPNPQSGVGGNVTMTVKTGSFAVNVSTQPTARNVIAGAIQFEFARYILDVTASGEDIRAASLPLAYDIDAGLATNLTNCKLYDGQSLSSTVLTTGSNILSPSAVSSSTVFTFDGSGLTLLKGTSKILSLRCDVSASASANDVFRWGLDGTVTYTGASGLGSGQEIAEVFTDAIGQNMTIQASGAYTVSNDTSVLYKVAEAGATNVTLAVLEFTANIDEDITVKQIALQLANTASNSPSDFVNQRVMLYNGATKVGEAQFGLSAGDNATSTLTTSFTIPKGETVDIAIKADLTTHDAVQGTPGAFVRVDYDGDNNGLNGNYATGADSGQTIDGTSGDQTTNGLRVFRTVPTFADVTTTSALAEATDLYKIKITAGSDRDVGLFRLTFNISTTGTGAVQNFTLHGPSGQINATGAETASNGNLIIAFDADDPDRLISKGASKTYALRVGTITTLTSANVETMRVKLLSDSAYPLFSANTLMGSVSDVDAATNDNIIWTPFSTTTPSAGSAAEDNIDWTNAYGLPGFPAVGQDFSVRSFTE